MLSIIERSCQSERQDKCLPHPQYGSVASDATLSRGLLQGSSDHTWANLLDVNFQLCPARFSSQDAPTTPAEGGPCTPRLAPIQHWASSKMQSAQPLRVVR